MSVEVNPNYPSDLDSSIPTASDFKAEGDDHIRNVKRVLKATLPNVSGAVTAAHTELNYSVGLTGAIQTQLDAKAPIASPTFTGTPAAPTATAGTSTTQIATTAFVAATAFSSVLPAQVGNSGKIITTDGTTASWTSTLTGQLNNAATVTIASAATVNIGAAASNDLIISGTTTITALGTIAAGATRKVKFSGALTLTHNATNLILPGTANITTAANDTAQFTSLGAGNWICDWYKRADGTSIVATAVGDHCVTLHTGNSVGSTNTGVRRFTTTLTNTGTAITLAQSATNGDSFTVNATGVYHIFYQDVSSSSGYIGFTVNGSDLTVATDSNTVATRGGLMWASAATRAVSVSRTMLLNSGDVVRAQSAGSVDGTNNFTYFSIRKVGA